MQTAIETKARMSPELVGALAAYRHKVFIERLGWNLPAYDGMEMDQFDRPDTVYVVGRDAHGRVCGSARLLPTDRPYLLADIFPEIMGGRELPRSPYVWELSRFAVSPASGRSHRALVDVSSEARLLLRAAIAYAAARGAARIITVSPLAVERLLHRLGVHAQRAAPPVLIDGRPSLACWIEIDDRTKAALDLDPSPSLAA